MKLRKEVQWFAEKMEKQLRKNDHKGGWKNCDIPYLEDKLKEELEEFNNTLITRSNRMISEGADVANIVMMLCDILVHDDDKLAKSQGYMTEEEWNNDMMKE
jgi:hypothetical protein